MLKTRGRRTCRRDATIQIQRASKLVGRVELSELLERISVVAVAEALALSARTQALQRELQDQTH